MVKELQSLCLDIRVLDNMGEEIELREEDDDDMVYTAGNETFITDENEVLSSGYAIDPDSVDSDVSALSEIIGLTGSDDDDDDIGFEEEFVFDPSDDEE